LILSSRVSRRAPLFSGRRAVPPVSYQPTASSIAHHVRDDDDDDDDGGLAPPPFMNHDETTD
jgi:hypothetical protein